MACETEMHIHYMMLAQDHFREALHLTRTSDRLDKIVHALESLDDAQHCGVHPKHLFGIRARFHEELTRTKETANRRWADGWVALMH